MKKLLPVMLIFWFSITLAQKSVIINGSVKNEQGEVLEGVIIRIHDTKNNIQTTTNSSGKYSLTASDGIIKISYTFTGYLPETLTFNPDSIKTFSKDIILQRYIQSLDEVIIQSGINGLGNARSIDVRLVPNLPSLSGNFESIIKTMPGVSPNNELSSQYSVRGGNFDENLVYVNDIEIYRPLLTHGGQQEGLSFINPDLATHSSFSAGGFRTRYGDKISSVLDVRYGRPDSSSSVVSVGLTNLSAVVKTLAANKKGYLLLGIRNKINRNILNKQNVKGSYNSGFYDLQLLAQKDISSKLSLSFLGNYNISRFSLIPENRETKFGTISESLEFNVNYEGKEQDRYATTMGAFTFLYKPSQTFNFKWISSIFDITEHENFNIKGHYILEGLQNIGSGNNPDYTIGSHLNYGNNELKAHIYSTEIRAYLQTKRSYFEWGVHYQRDQIKDKLDEYSRIDSKTAGSQDTSVLTNIAYGDNSILINRFMGFFENTFEIFSGLRLYAGVRGNYNSYTKEILGSPRIGMFFAPASAEDLSFRFSAGIYNQPPFYRELRNLDGSLNPESKAQRSIQFLTGIDYGFKNSPLKFTSELYYKKLNKLIPYKIEDLKIRYLADQHSRGYATGIDFNLHGEFVNNMESFFRLSLMKTAENVAGDTYITKNNVLIVPGYLRRPTDQRVNFSIFFQDRVLDNPSNKVHVNLLYGSALMSGPPQTERYADVFKIPSYKRIDIGFSKDFVDPNGRKKSAFLQRYFSSFNAYAEIFNMLNIDNTVSYLWIRDVNSNQYAIPNYLTSRQLNIRIIANIKYK